MVNYDESEDEEDVNLKSNDLPPPSAVLPVDQDDEVDLRSDELAEILADGPISCRKRSKDSETERTVIGTAVDDREEAGGVFELADWV